RRSVTASAPSRSPPWSTTRGRSEMGGRRPRCGSVRGASSRRAPQAGGAAALVGLVVAGALVLTPAALVVPVVGVAAPVRSAAEAQGASEALEHQGEIFSFGITVPDEPITAGDSIVFPNASE